MHTQALLPPCALQPHREAMPMGLVPVSSDHQGTPKPSGAAVYTDPPHVLQKCPYSPLPTRGTISPPSPYPQHASHSLSPGFLEGLMLLFGGRGTDLSPPEASVCPTVSFWWPDALVQVPAPVSSPDTPHTTSMSLPSPHAPQVSSRTLSHIPGLDTEGTSTKEMDRPQVPPLCPLVLRNKYCSM